MKKWVGVIAILLAALAAVVAINASRLRSNQIQVAPNDELSPPVAAAAQRLAQAVRYRTVSHQDPASFPGAEFERFQAFLARTYPRIRSAMHRGHVGVHSLLYEWPGRDTSLKPILVMAHQDVVPVDPASAGQWLQLPFGGIIADGFIWGRGTLDDKGAVMALHEAT
ncbi:MAG: M20/M25/M40 family metallo-hydrolase, partial [Betaproteobacteria bacterium]